MTQIVDAAQKFLTYDYAETKDLCKSFLTLVSGILVFSVAFGEKIVDFRGAKASGRWCLFGCWVLLVVAIVSNGIGLTIIAIAGGQAAYGSSAEGFYSTAQIAYKWIVLGGAGFILGMISLVWAGALSLFEKR